MKGSTVLKSLQWCRKQADVQAWSFLESPLIQGWMKSKVPADRRESLPLPLYVVVQWERRLLQANIPLREIIIIGGFLLMIWTGLRFSDLQRVTITSVVCSASEIRGISWRTKTCSKGQPWGARASGFLSVGSVTWLSKFVCAWDAVLAAFCDVFHYRTLVQGFVRHALSKHVSASWVSLNLQQEINPK
jgi:hypothetical protein